MAHFVSQINRAGSGIRSGYTLPRGTTSYKVSGNVVTSKQGSSTTIANVATGETAEKVTQTNIPSTQITVPLQKVTVKPSGSVKYGNITYTGKAVLPSGITANQYANLTKQQAVKENIIKQSQINQARLTVTKQPEVSPISEVQETGTIFQQPKQIVKSKVGDWSLSNWKLGFKNIGIGLGLVSPGYDTLYTSDTTNVTRSATPEEIKYYSEQIKLGSVTTDKPSFKQKIVTAYKGETNFISGGLKALGVTLRTAEEGRMRITPTFGEVITSQVSPSTYKSQKVVKLYTHQKGGEIAPYFLPGGVGPAIFLAEGALARFSPKAIVKFKEREETLKGIGFSPGDAKQYSTIGADVRLAAGIVGFHAYLKSTPKITRLPTTKQIKLVQEKINIGSKIKTNYQIQTLTTSRVLVKQRGLVVLGSPQLITKTRLDVLKTIPGGLTVQGNKVYGYVASQRAGAKLSKIYQIVGRADKINRADISKLAPTQKQLLTGFKTQSLKTSEFSLASVQLKEVGKFSGGKFTPYSLYKSPGRQSINAVVGGKTDPLRYIIMRKGNTVNIITKFDKNKHFFTEVYGKRLGEGLPRLAKEKDLYKMDIFSTIKKIKDPTGVRFVTPAKITKTPFSTTFSPQITSQPTIKLSTLNLPTTSLVSVTTGGTATAFAKTIKAPVISITQPTTSRLSTLLYSTVLTKSSQFPTSMDRIKFTQVMPSQTKQTTPTKEITKVSSILKTPSVSKSSSIFKTAQVIKQPLVTKPIVITKPIIITKPFTFIPSPPLKIKPATKTKGGFRFKLPKYKQPVKLSYGKFNVLSRRFGKFKPIGVGRTEKEAFSIGKKYVGSTLAVTFKVPKSKKLKLPGFKTKITKKGILFIEPRGKRLKKGTKEIPEIQLYKKIKSKGRKKKK